jgi:hypothetical protein
VNEAERVYKQDTRKANPIGTVERWFPHIGLITRSRQVATGLARARSFGIGVASILVRGETDEGEDMFHSDGHRSLFAVDCAGDGQSLSAKGESLSRALRYTESPLGSGQKSDDDRGSNRNRRSVWSGRLDWLSGV